ncbi:hypothetical protein KBY28_08270 [Ruegeria pomeroyi]|nr:hypothetical protein [Ruegeria pomeroyi]MCE8508439.1 hypothetical protein [Ruegeria pomeroyi]
MRYLRPISLTWWAGCLALTTGTGALFLPDQGQRAALAGLIALLSVLASSACVTASSGASKASGDQEGRSSHLVRPAFRRFRATTAAMIAPKARPAPTDVIIATGIGMLFRDHTANHMKMPQNVPKNQLKAIMLALKLR